MPELPETEIIARDLDAALRGAVIRVTTVLRADVLRGLPLAGRAAAPYVGQPILRVFRRAKAIVIEFVGQNRLVVVPRFTGALLLSPAPAHQLARAATLSPSTHPYCCVQFQLADGRTLEYTDVRRLGTVSLLSADAFATWLAVLGPEPLDPALSAESFSGILRGTRRAVKTVLMDQKRLAGVGNIYSNEALFRAGIRPTRRASGVTRRESETLLAALREVLRESIALRGTTFRDFQDAYGRRGGFAAQLRVYGRGGLPCVDCGATLQETQRLEGRSTVWCRACQR